MGIVTGGSSGNDIEIVTTVKDFTGEPIRRITKRIEELGKTTRQITVTTEDLRTGFSKTTETIEKGMQRFKFMGLNFLFFGMFLQRTFGGILQSGVSTFRNITETAYGSAKAISAVAAAGTFLAFTIGDALNTILEPLLPTIIGIVNKTADFIQQHPGVVALVAAVAALGTAFVILGVLLTYFQNVTLPQVMGLFKGLGTILADIGTAITTGTISAGLLSLISNLLLVGIILGILVGGWDKFKNAGGAAFDFIAGIAEGDFRKAEDSVFRFIRNTSAGLAQGAAFVTIFFARVIAQFIAFAADIFGKLGSRIVNTFTTAFDVLTGKVPFDKFLSELEKRTTETDKFIEESTKRMAENADRNAQEMFSNVKLLTDDIAGLQKKVGIEGIPNLRELPEARLSTPTRFDFIKELQQAPQTVNIGGPTINISAPAINTEIDFKRVVTDPIIEVNRDIANALVGTSRIS